MIIFPAIDIKGGKCVRLFKGDFRKVTDYNKTPLEQAKEFNNFGISNVHIIDLDGALKGKLVNINIIKDIIKKTNLKIQVGGGIRSLENIEELLNIGVDMVIIGTSGIENINFLEKACDKFKKKIALSLDVRNGLLALSGWKKQTNIKALEFLKEIKNFGISRIIYTDINKDGTKEGPNIEETINFSKYTNIPVIVSGGIASINDIIAIKKKENTNIKGIIVGKALYDGSINIKELIKVL